MGQTINIYIYIKLYRDSEIFLISEMILAYLQRYQCRK